MNDPTPTEAPQETLSCMGRCFYALGQWTTQSPWRVLLGAAVVTLVAATQVAQLRFDASFMGMLPKDDPRVERFRDATLSFGGTSSLLLLVDGEEQARWAFLDELAPALRALPGVKALEVRADLLSVEPPPEAVALPQPVIEDLISLTQEEPALVRRCLTEPGLTTLAEGAVDLATRRGIELASRRRFAAPNPEVLEVMLRAAKGQPPGPRDVLDLLRAGAPGLPRDELDPGGRLVSKDGRANLAILRLATDITQMAVGFEDYEEIVQATERVAARHEVRWGYAGVMAYGHEDQQHVLGRVRWLSGISLVLVLVLFLYVDRSPRVAILVGSCLALGLVWTFALVVAVFGVVTLTSAVFGVLLFGLAVDFAIHLVVRIRDEQAEAELEEAIRRALLTTGPGVLTGGLTTCFAFFALTVSDQPAASHLGFTTGVGLLSSLIAMLVVLPALLTLFGGRRGVGQAPAMRVPALDRWTTLCTARPRTVLLGAALVTAVAAGLILPRAHLEYDVDKIATQGTQAQAVQQEVAQRFTITADHGLCVVEDLATAARVASALRVSPRVRRVDAASDFLSPDPAQVKRVLDQLGAALEAAKLPAPGPDAFGPAHLKRLGNATARMQFLAGQAVRLLPEGPDRLTAQKLEAASASLGEAIRSDPEAAARGLRSLDARIASTIRNLALTTRAGTARAVGANDLPEALRGKFFDPRGRTVVYAQPKASVLDGRGIRTFLADLDAASPAGGTGIPIVVVILLDEMIDDMPKILLAAALIIVLLLLVDLRRGWFVLITFLPLGVAAVWAAAIVVLAGYPYSLLTLAGLPLVFGIGVDDGVHLVHRFREEGDPAAAAAAVGRAILLTTITTVISFGGLLFLNHIGLTTLALLVGSGVALCFVMSVTVFPAAVTLLRLNADGQREAAA